MTTPQDTRGDLDLDRDLAAAPADRATLARPVRTSARTHRKAPLAWLPWALLGALAALLALTLLLVNAIDDDGAPGSADDALGQLGGDAGSSQSRTGGAGSAEDAALSAGGTDLLAAPGGRVGALAGQEATGRAVVESVVADEGFWVGESAARRVFVFLTPEARRSAGESGFQVTKGQTVSVRGTVARADAAFAERVGVTAAEGRQQLLDQGGHVEATEVGLAG